jgi:predicted ribosomally synthesized peptide with nif11-like leader
MSIQAVSEFFEKIKVDANIAATYGEALRVSRIRTTVETAAAAGFDFTAEELAEFSTGDGQELSDEVLDSVSGGWGRGLGGGV